MFRTSTSLRRAALPLLACLFLAGCSSDATDGPSATAPGSSRTATVDAPARAGSTGTGSAGAGKSGDAPAAAPVRISIPSLGIDSELMRLGLNQDGTVEVPPAEKGMTAGWYTGGAAPGERGAAVVIGHNDTRFGKAVFHDLKKITEGADIAVRNDRGAELHFRVTATETVSKKAFPTEKVYGSTGARTLRLITCDGAFDAQGHPVDNLIVYANRS
ncbi:class F sortase [Streptomyces sp. NBC_00257]|uniref:class F sortase n=1 Tax=unclassified Streptomyces TaxID=2593676 RepID=UPI002251B0A2|nr:MULTISPECIES: class F sortase [unclassified Streptomyces]WSW04169.1 class F sortase [Streptomyces sp. NBC_01005]WTB58249.1 class F sortase [Streptomyces sp. NBC_00826]WTC93674.1 class F sortase [Streptomyces sp. NBC_01650]WTH88871.1 class F sortase [Streptomyces sp. NBC_00825]WTH97601.1 class F sortase [Streptomyces sp. NBC_00822]